MNKIKEAHIKKVLNKTWVSDSHGTQVACVYFREGSPYGSNVAQLRFIRQALADAAHRLSYSAVDEAYVVVGNRNTGAYRCMRVLDGGFLQV